MGSSEMEPLYWSLEDSLLEGRVKRAQAIYGVIAYAAKCDRQIVAAGLREPHRRRLKELTHELFGDGGAKKKTSIVMRPPISPVPLPFTKDHNSETTLPRNPRS